MMKIAKLVFKGIVGLLVLLGIIGFFLPKQYSVTCSIVIQAPVETVFEAVNNFRSWEHWSPWHTMDPTNQVRYEGPVSGVGSVMTWRSENKKVGSGRQEIITSDPNTYIKTSLSFSGWDNPSYATWNFKSITDHETSVTWSYLTEVGNNVLHKYFSLLIMPTLEKNYNEGLEHLKNYTEKQG